MSAGPQRDTLTSRLSSTFWLLLNTPMIPPEENVESQAVQMTDFPDTRGAHPHEKTRSSMDSYATEVSDASGSSS
ncbi:hypothetical protein OH76DRAFT_1485429 [Lentinus brumalis]|uniref:Uncharacterized protein n=1 Tax=Lentinus brumalis TaxID=2498619 RepID=A0A371D1Z0_9APHY|nr:hypothetical protein OH76DRAFT_1485429 [Polyporus brumalis]